MKKKILVLLLLAAPLAFLSGATHAQGRFDASVFAGLNMCQIDGDAEGGYNHPGLRAGVGTSFPLSSDVHSPWRMVVELAFTNKGSFIKDYDYTYSVSYIELPLMLCYSAMDTRLRLAAGVAPALRVAATASYGDQLAADNFTAVDWLPLTASVSYRFGDHLGIEGRYQNSMLSVTKQNGSGTYRIFRSNTGCFHNLVTVGLTYLF